MRIRSVQLVWFRGAAAQASLETNLKSTVVYGENGSGKSSFIDAIEHAIREGKIGHLTHEESGKRLEKAVPNTHTPKDSLTEFKIVLEDKSEVLVKIQKDGTWKKDSGGANLEQWDYRCTVLRQNEVSDFVLNTKGEKYSALLPLLGLQHLENCAENLRKLPRLIEQESNLKANSGTIEQIAIKRKAAFGEDDNLVIDQKISALYSIYCAGKTAPIDPSDKCRELISAIDKRIQNSSADQRRHIALSDAGGAQIRQTIDAIAGISNTLSDSIEPLISEKLQVLQSAEIFAGKLSEDDVTCPACGTILPSNQLKTHIANEKQRLQEIITAFNERKALIGQLCDATKLLQNSLTKPDLATWVDHLRKGPLSNNLTYLDRVNVESMREKHDALTLADIKNQLTPITEEALRASQDAPPEAQTLSTDKQAATISLEIFQSIKLAEQVSKIGVLNTFIRSIEEKAREEIRQQSLAIIKEISADIQVLWGILHPNEKIEDVRLHLPKNTDKAIDICLKFHGIEQASPRLTLSEGFRNSLGLCIFLAMAKRVSSPNRPIFLDDVVVSIDRNHRGMIADLLERTFANRQIVLLTHDRDWFIELKQQLDGGIWIFRALMPYESPEIGIRWSEKIFGFDDARSSLESAPDQAGNIARKIMDIELASRAERLKVLLPYLHRERNDHRTAHEFLSEIISEAKKCMEMKTDGNFKPHEKAIEAFERADKLLISWANKGSHTFDVTKSEAKKLIDACEEALSYFDCSICRKSISKLDDKNARLTQCECGALRWRYGKA